MTEFTKTELRLLLALAENELDLAQSSSPPRKAATVQSAIRKLVAQLRAAKC
jgi:hypothetical protein